ncbi:MAG TPA: helix-turn-helix domain-containing protein [Candidatus Dormibacteraeota bacterium]|nr:helix-turn-helix domain-containing protein [Candidatus Dormibacteraeota bacterium]
MIDRDPRERVLTTARAVVAMKKGRATVDDFVQAAGISKTSFYRAFGSRAALLDALGLAPTPGAREQILRLALDMVGTRGLAALSMDELADRAGVSRATLYRLFPGKPALFTALVHAYSPLDPVIALLDERQDQPPETVMPEVARAVYRTVVGGEEDRTGLMRALFAEVTSLAPEAEEATRDAIVRVVGAVAGYVLAQMAAGRLRQMHPLLALQSFIGPIFFHLMTRKAAQAVLGVEMDEEQAVIELAESWLRAMRIEERREE